MNHDQADSRQEASDGVLSQCDTTLWRHSFSRFFFTLPSLAVSQAIDQHRTARSNTAKHVIRLRDQRLPYDYRRMALLVSESSPQAFKCLQLSDQHHSVLLLLLLIKA